MMNDVPEGKLLPPPQVLVYGRKRGHLKAVKEVWLKETLAKYRLPGGQSRSEMLDFFGLDPEKSRICLEIGFGNGISLAGLAKRYPNDLFIGVDLFLEGIASFLGRAERDGLGNVRVYVGPAQEFLANGVAEGCLDRVIVNFPDPWPKTRHHKRRLIQPAFLSMLASRMCTGASLELATDWAEYSDWMLECLENCPNFRNVAGQGHFAQPPEDWVVTRFQEKGLAAGRPTRRLHFLKILCPEKEG